MGRQSIIRDLNFLIYKINLNCWDRLWMPSSTIFIREAEWDLVPLQPGGDGKIKQRERERFEDVGLEDWSDTATNWGVLAATWNCKRQRTNCPTALEIDPWISLDPLSVHKNTSAHQTLVQDCRMVGLFFQNRQFSKIMVPMYTPHQHKNILVAPRPHQCLLMCLLNFSKLISYCVINLHFWIIINAYSYCPFW